MSALTDRARRIAKNDPLCWDGILIELADQTDHLQNEVDRLRRSMIQTAYNCYPHDHLLAAALRKDFSWLKDKK